MKGLKDNYYANLQCALRELEGKLESLRRQKEEVSKLDWRILTTELAIREIKKEIAEIGIGVIPKRKELLLHDNISKV